MDGFKDRVNTNPIPVRRSNRIDEIRLLTSMDAGKIVPLSYIPMLREDRLRSTRLRYAFEMEETAEPLMNGVMVELQAWFVSKLALDRFDGMDALNRSYEGAAYPDGGSVISWTNNAAFGTQEANEIFVSMGLHGATTDQVTQDIVESYNQIVNHRREQRSPSLTQRTLTDSTLAEAFWHHTQMRHIVPSFDQARIDGEVPLNIIDSKLPVLGIGQHITTYNQTVNPASVGVNEPTSGGNWSASSANVYLREDQDNAGQPDVYALLGATNGTITLADIELAKKTTYFARLRERYSGHDDDYIIDLLMQGIAIPDQELKHPVLLGKTSGAFGFQSRYASDYANLEKSFTNGELMLDLMLRTPQINTGGLIMITAEITPEQIFERQKDYYFHATSVDDMPHYLRDELDPEKVSVVQNRHVDVDHSTPDATFGYAPLNHEWMRRHANVGGKYYRHDSSAAWDEQRQKIWAVESADPTLSEDFYLCTAFHENVFAQSVEDNFNVVGRGEAVIDGLTVFGAELEEAETGGGYDDVIAEVDQTRIDQSA